LRRRLFYITASVTLFGGLAYAINEPITHLLLRPAGSQQFIYTTPGGGFDFLFKLCVYTGLAASIPVIVYQILRYAQPLIKKDAMHFIAWGSIASGFLAVAGIIFGYIVGLPAAMHFLLQGFSSKQITALISIQSYLSFVMLYLLGAALLFQVPLILVLINRIKPIKPGKLMKFQRWFIVISFVFAAVISPTPDAGDLLMLAIPMILMYQIGVILVWSKNRRHRRPKKVAELIQKDAEAQAQRLAHFESAQAAWNRMVENSTPVKTGADATPPTPQKPASPPAPTRQRRYAQDFTRRPPQRVFIRTPQTD
jgi:sec-independent protein translocase protein TatC